MYPTSFSPNLSLSGYFFPWLFWKCAPRLCKKHTFEDPHEAFLTTSLDFSTSKCLKQSLSRSWFSAISLLCTFVSLAVSHMSPKLNLKKLRKRVYYCYKCLPWPTLMTYPTPLRRHFHVCHAIVVEFLCIQHHFHRLFHFPAICFMNFLKICSPLM